MKGKGVQEGFANFEDSRAQEVGLLNLINTREMTFSRVDDAVVGTKPRSGERIR